MFNLFPVMCMYGKNLKQTIIVSLLSSLYACNKSRHETATFTSTDLIHIE
jgi:hypothetical protein